MDESQEFDKKNAIKIRVLPVTQPIGTFYVGVTDAQSALGICSAEPRVLRNSEEEEDELEQYIGIQRPLNKKRVEEIKNYVKTWDATFPNSVILAIRPGMYLLEDDYIYITKDKKSSNIIDGQHRLAGFLGSTMEKFDVILTLFTDLELEEQTYIFSVINTKMTRINPSLSQDLYAFASLETPEKLAHNIARDFNITPTNPWYDKIKMIGKKEKDSTAILSQSAFAKGIIDLIYDQKDAHSLRDLLKKGNNDRKYLEELNKKYSTKKIFWDIYQKGEDGFMFTILKNYFAAVKSVFPEEWDDPSKILIKTTGYNALITVLKTIYEKGSAEKDLSEQFFFNLFTMSKNSGKIGELTSTPYNPGRVGETKLANNLLIGMGLMTDVKNE